MLGRAIPRHVLHHTNATSPSGYYQQFRCDCGATLTGTLKKSGELSARLDEEWEGHLSLYESDPKTFIVVGTIVLANSQQQVVVFPKTAAGITDWTADSRFALWIANASHNWVTGTIEHRKSSTKKLIRSLSVNQEKAIDNALKFIRKAEISGRQVEVIDKSQVMKVVKTPFLEGVADLITQADYVCTNFDALVANDVITQLDEVISLGPVAKSKRDLLQERINEMLGGR